MIIRVHFSPTHFVAGIFLLSSLTCIAQSQSHTLLPICHPTVSKPVVVASHEQVLKAGERVEPPLTDTMGFGFAWPDTAMGVIKTEDSYAFFTSDGAYHPVMEWRGHEVGSNNFGSVTRTIGTLENPLGSGDPQDVTISPNPDPAVNPNFSSYSYIGGGPVFRVPDGMTGAGNLIVGYHAELPGNALYVVHGLAASLDGGLHWTDLGEVVRPNQSFSPELTGGDEVGDGPLVLSPDGKEFYFYFPEWPGGSTATTTISVARAPVASVVEAAFGSKHPHMVPFEKFYQGTWNFQPGIGGASTNLIPNSPYGGYLDVHFDDYLHRYVLITSDDTNFAYAESLDGINWSTPQLIGTYGPIAAYPTSVGLGEDPSILGRSFYTYYTFIVAEDGGLPRKGNYVGRLTLTCQ